MRRYLDIAVSAVIAIVVTSLALLIASSVVGPTIAFCAVMYVVIRYVRKPAKRTAPRQLTIIRE